MLRKLVTSSVSVAAISTAAVADPLIDAKAGLNALNRGDSDAAIELFTKAVRAGTLSKADLELAYEKRAEAYALASNKTLALADLNAALRLDPSDLDAIQLQKRLQSNDISDPGGPAMVEIKPGEFMMGSANDEPGRSEIEGPQHRVRIAYRFAVSKYPITVGEFDTFVRETSYDTGNGCAPVSGAGVIKRIEYDWRSPGFPQSSNNPAVCISYIDAQNYLAWLSRKTGHAYRLLSESEYEYVNRAGTTTAYWWGGSVGSGHANCAGCGSVWDLQSTAPVGAFAPNSFALYDTSGNASSWVSDCVNTNYSNAPLDGSENTAGDCSGRMFRGGFWNATPGGLRSAYRGRAAVAFRGNMLGFRIARTL